MDIQMYLSLKGVSKRSFPLKFTSAGRWQRRLSVWGAQRLSGFRSVNNCLTLEPIQNAAAIHEARGASPSMRERRNDATYDAPERYAIATPKAPSAAVPSVFLVAS